MTTLQDLSFLTALLANFLILAGFLILPIIALVALRQRKLNSTASAMWAVLIVVVPLLAPPALILWGIWKFATRKSGKPASGG